PYESRGSSTVLGARGGEIPPRDSTAPPVLPHHPDLARSTARRSHGGSRVDCCDNHQSRPESCERARYRELPEGHQSQQCRDENPRRPRRRIPSRMELHHPPAISRKSEQLIRRVSLEGGIRSLTRLPETK